MPQRSLSSLLVVVQQVQLVTQSANPGLRAHAAMCPCVAKQHTISVLCVQRAMRITDIVRRLHCPPLPRRGQGISLPRMTVPTGAGARGRCAGERVRSNPRVHMRGGGWGLGSVLEGDFGMMGERRTNPPHPLICICICICPRKVNGRSLLTGLSTLGSLWEWRQVEVEWSGFRRGGRHFSGV